MVTQSSHSPRRRNNRRRANSPVRRSPTRRLSPTRRRAGEEQLPPNHPQRSPSPRRQLRAIDYYYMDGGAGVAGAM